MNRFINRGLCALLLGGALLASGCEEDPAKPGDGADLEGERPNTVILAFVDQGNPADTIRATWRDLDGDGGANPVVDTVRLAGGRVYNGTITALLRKSNPDTLLPFNPTYRKFADEHQFFYQSKGDARITFTTTDRDAKGLPLGLEFIATVVNTPAVGAINVVLGHFDEAPKDGVTRSPESDIDADFPVRVR